MRKTLYVSNLEPWVTNRVLCLACVPHGRVISCRIATMRNGRSRGFGFVTFASQADSDAALKGISGTILGSAAIEATYAWTPNPVHVLGPKHSNRRRSSSKRKKDFLNLNIKDIISWPKRLRPKKQDKGRAYWNRFESKSNSAYLFSRGQRPLLHGPLPLIKMFPVPEQPHVIFWPANHASMIRSPPPLAPGLKYQESKREHGEPGAVRGLGSLLLGQLKHSPWGAPINM